MHVVVQPGYDSCSRCVKSGGSASAMYESIDSSTAGVHFHFGRMHLHKLDSCLLTLLSTLHRSSDSGTNRPVLLALDEHSFRQHTAAHS